jgi:hypothetical protein
MEAHPPTLEVVAENAITCKSRESTNYSAKQTPYRDGLAEREREREICSPRGVGEPAACDSLFKPFSSPNISLAM